MEMVNEIKFKKQSFNKRLKSMLKVDFRRMFTMPLFYIMIGIAAVIPILVLVMTTYMGDMPNPNPSTPSMEIEPFTNVWQVIAQTSLESSSAELNILSMCNTSLLYFALAVFVCIFVADDFRSGYSKNLFTVRSDKKDYIISKSLIGFACGACMIIAYFIGAMIGGAISQLSFDPGVAGIDGIVMCIISRIFIMGLFTPIYLLVGVIAKPKLWLSLICSLAGNMLFFMIVPMIAPLDSGILNVIITFIGAIIFSVGVGMISNAILKKTNIL